MCSPAATNFLARMASNYSGGNCIARAQSLAVPIGAQHQKALTCNQNEFRVSRYLKDKTLVSSATTVI
jgi:hypothetical protein